MPLPLAVPAMEWANSAAPRSVATLHMYRAATELFEKSCSVRSQPLSAQGRRRAQRSGPAAPPEQQLRLALEGMVAAEQLMARTAQVTAPADGACSSQQPAAGRGLAADLSAPAVVSPSSGLIWDAASCSLAWSVRAAVSLAPAAAEAIPQVVACCDTPSELCLRQGPVGLCELCVACRPGAF